jgi:hypothetical protein
MGCFGGPDEGNESLRISPRQYRQVESLNDWDVYAARKFAGFYHLARAGLYPKTSQSRKQELPDVSFASGLQQLHGFLPMGMEEEGVLQQPRKTVRCLRVEAAGSSAPHDLREVGQ